MVRNPVAVILGGGKGERLYPLTAERSKAAVPFGSQHRLIDIALSNCINSGYSQISVLTQFNSISLNQHIARCYRFDRFSSGYVEILAAQQTPNRSEWYQGTADAVRKNLDHLRRQSPSHYFILPSDQLCKINLAHLFQCHISRQADVTLAVTPVPRVSTASYGVVLVGADDRIENFLEKPSPETDMQSYRSSAGGDLFLASMGMYCFNAEILEQALRGDASDFGREMLPDLVRQVHCSAYVYNDFWIDVGSIPNFYQTSLSLVNPQSYFTFFDPDWPIYTDLVSLPASKIVSASISRSMIGNGVKIRGASIAHSIIGIRSVIEQEVELDSVICMGADYYDFSQDRSSANYNQRPSAGIGKNSKIKTAIIDKNARIGKNCRLGIDANIKRRDVDGAFYSIRDGIIIIPKNAVVPDGTTL